MNLISRLVNDLIKLILYILNELIDIHTSLRQQVFFIAAPQQPKNDITEKNIPTVIKRVSGNSDFFETKKFNFVSPGERANSMYRIKVQSVLKKWRVPMKIKKTPKICNQLITLKYIRLKIYIII